MRFIIYFFRIGFNGRTYLSFISKFILHYDYARRISLSAYQIAQVPSALSALQVLKCSSAQVHLKYPVSALEVLFE